MQYITETKLLYNSREQWNGWTAPLLVCAEHRVVIEALTCACKDSH